MAFLEMQVTGEGDRSHRPVGAAAAETNHAPPNRLRLRQRPSDIRLGC
jgi:hypothetical protein